MDFFQTIEDPRHTPGKRHGYAKEQLSPQTFSNNNQKFLIRNFITTPPVVKPQNHFTSYSINRADKFYQIKQQKQEHSNYRSLYPSQKSAFFAYRRPPNQKPPKIQIEPPSIIDDLPNDGILRPKPRYVTTVSQSYNKNTTDVVRIQFCKNSNSGKTQIIGIDRTDSREEDTIAQQQQTKVACSELGSRESPMIVEKKVEDLPRLKNFKNILNKFQIASDHALQQQQQRERIRCNASDYKSDQRINIPNWEKSIETTYSEHDYKLTKNKSQYLRAFTISVPTDGKNNRDSLPKQWITQVNDTHMDMDMEQRSPTMSGISSISQSSPLSSAHKPPNRTNSLKLVSMKQQRASFDNCFHRNEPMIRQFRYNQNVNRSRSISEIEGQRNPTGCIIGCSSTQSCKDFAPLAQMSMSSHSPLIPPLESRRVKRSISSKTKEDDSTMPVIGLYKQAEPVGTHSIPMKSDLSVGNIWNPPILTEIKAQQNEEQRILQGTLRHQNSQKYRFLIIPRYNLLTFRSFAANHRQDVNEEYEQMVCFILLQILCALKSFQLNGIESISDDLSEFILLCRCTRTNPKIDNTDYLPRILLLQEPLKMTNKKPIIGLCNYGLKILSTMLNSNRNSPTNFTSPIQECARALQQDKSNSLTEAKNALEFGMFVGDDISSFSDEEDIQAWIDSKRADYVNYLFREVIDGSCSLNEVYERLRLQFLLSITPRTLLKIFENIKSSKFLDKTPFYV
ncbi:unnamed protein product [Cercopithifilaria johnstoni]|uniref:Uncharacterized protein n=1 Tax=Cercopithifilaria johnstoni TaxID=2874296 RepID=A0A8J2MRA1_9BILA|nr:unnamed protein product [Cercopithifilaria johnstoni]